MNGDRRMDLLGGLAQLGMKPTRIDGALDWVGCEIDLCESATAACHRKELCLMRRFRPHDEFTSEGVATRRHLALGSRESPVCARIYDKGKEQGVAPAGHWERFEVEWKGDRAPKVVEELLASRSAWPETLQSLILGAVEFRENNGRSERERRPMAEWWQRVLGGADAVRVAAEEKKQTFERWHRWAQRSFWPRFLELAERSNSSISDLAGRFCEGVVPSTMGGPIVAEFLALTASD